MYLFKILTIILCSLFMFSCTKKTTVPEENPKDIPAPKIGDYYYSDGSWSTEYDYSKSVIGIVFWSGDPTAEDPALRAEHPQCSHGLAIALDQESSAWQTFYEQSGTSVCKWTESHISDYSAPEANIGINEPLQKILGYNNTKAIEAYNAAPENKKWPVEAITKTVAYRSKVPAPEESSDWYLPSPKELSLLCAGEIDGDIYIKENILTNIILINSRLEAINIPPITTNAFWSSTEASQSWEAAWNYFFDNVRMPLSISFKAWTEGYVRPVIAF